jgi:hypothetical protein
MWFGTMAEKAAQVIPLKLVGGRVVIQPRKVVGFLWSRETYLRVAREVTANRRRTAAWRAYDKKIRELEYLLHLESLPNLNHLFEIYPMPPKYMPAKSAIEMRATAL